MPRGTIVIRSDDREFVEDQRRLLSQNLSAPTDHSVYEALDVNCETLQKCITNWARHPKLVIDRGSLFNSWE